MTAAKANSACLIGRVAKVGEGHRLAAKRRARIRREEEGCQEGTLGCERGWEGSV